MTWSPSLDPKRVLPHHGGVKFKLTAMPRTRYRGRHARITMATVRAMRAWAAREGWVLKRKEQAAHLARNYGIAATTAIDVLTNSSWHDPAYMPKQIDATYWRDQQPTMVLLRLLAGN
jgi:hypothetical protein